MRQSIHDVIPTREQLSAPYSLSEADAFIASLGVSRHAQHLLNETLWRSNVGPQNFAARPPAQRQSLILSAARHVRPEAQEPAVVRELLGAIR